MNTTLTRFTRTLQWGAVAAATWACTQVSAQSLSTLVATAKGYDAQVLAAQKQVDVAVAQADRSRAGLLPTVGLGASATVADVDWNAHSKSRALSLSASQPIYNKTNALNVDQAQLGIESARIQLRQAEQDLMTRRSKAYFD